MNEESEEDNAKAHLLQKLQERLGLYFMELPVLGFNLVKNEQVKFVIKGNDNHMCLKTMHLKFLDITNYLAPGFSYDQFLKDYQCALTKGYFPYQWTDYIEKLNFPTLPLPEAFHSPLSNTDITEGQYEYCQRVRYDNNMETFRDFLV